MKQPVSFTRHKCFWYLVHIQVVLLCKHKVPSTVRLRVNAFRRRLERTCFSQDCLRQHCMASFDDHRGIWRMSFATIWSHYVRTWFFVDAISCVPFDLIAMFMNNSIHRLFLLRVVRVLRCLRLIRLLKTARFGSCAFIFFSTHVSVNCSQAIWYLKRGPEFAASKWHWQAGMLQNWRTGCGIITGIHHVCVTVPVRQYDIQ